MKQTLWTRNFTRITAATTLGAAGGIISQFALSFLVFDETGSTLASALVVAIQLIPMVLLPLVVAPMMDRLPRKPFLVWGDLLNGLCYAGAGLFLLHSAFSYTAYLAFSLLVSCLAAFDELAYNSFYPLLLPEGQEERAYTVSAMLYPILKVLMMPLAALLYDILGVGRLLLIQGALSVLAALIENRIHVQESRRDQEPLLSLKTWWRDIREAAAYLRQEHGLHGLYEYMAVTNGMAMGYSPHRRRRPLPLLPAGAKAIRLPVRGVSDLRTDGRLPSVAAVSPDAGEPSRLRLSGHPECHHPAGGGAALHPRPAAGSAQCL